MSSNVVLLTTPTPHHLYFAWKLREHVPLTGIMLETRSLRAPFKTSHPLEKLRDDYERQALLHGAPKKFEELTRRQDVDSCNDPPSLSILKRWAPDWMIVFGTGLLKPAVIQAARAGTLNLHGGDPERYRGLDSHYWTIYHRDFEHLTTTLHFMDEELDTGDIVSQRKLVLKRGMGLHQLRALNTRACVDLALSALDQAGRSRRLEARKQKTKGRYYSFMPAALKDICFQNFNRHVEGL